MVDLLGDLAPHHPIRFHVWSPTHTGYHVRGRYGFASELRFAGKFSRKEADAIVAEGNGDIAIAVVPSSVDHPPGGKPCLT